MNFNLVVFQIILNFFVIIPGFIFINFLLKLIIQKKLYQFLYINSNILIYILELNSKNYIFFKFELLMDFFDKKIINKK